VEGCTYHKESLVGINTAYEDGDLLALAVLVHGYNFDVSSFLWGK